MKVKLEPKYSEIQRKLYQNHKLNGFDAGTKATNGLIDEVSKMIAEALQMIQQEESKEDWLILFTYLIDFFRNIIIIFAKNIFVQ